MKGNIKISPALSVISKLIVCRLPESDLMEPVIAQLSFFSGQMQQATAHV
jgi:hypothetical protein